MVGLCCKCKPMSCSSRALYQICHRVCPSPTSCTDCAPNESNTTLEHLGSCKRYKNRKSRNLSPPMQMARSPCYTHNGISDADSTRRTHKLSCTNSGNIGGGGCATNLSLANKWHLVWTRIWPIPTDSPADKFSKRTDVSHVTPSKPLGSILGQHERSAGKLTGYAC